MPETTMPETTMPETVQTTVISIVYKDKEKHDETYTGVMKSWIEDDYLYMYTDDMAKRIPCSIIKLWSRRPE